MTYLTTLVMQCTAPSSPGFPWLPDAKTPIGPGLVMRLYDWPNESQRVSGMGTWQGTWIAETFKGGSPNIPHTIYVWYIPPT